jgi:hypothetical protein
MAELALDDVERDPVVGERDGVGVAQLVRREAAPHTGLRGDAPQLGAGGVARPGPPTGGTVDHAHGRSPQWRLTMETPSSSFARATAVSRGDASFEGTTKLCSDLSGGSRLRPR